MSDEASQNVEATGADSMADLAAQIPQESSNQQQDAAPQQPASSEASDMEAFIQSQKAQLTELATEVKTSNQTVQEFAQREAKRALDEAVDNAVAKINDGVNGDDKLADAFLNSQYQRDENFARLFDNREKNPAAYEKALGILKDEWSAMNQNRIDPQVAENQRALRESQQGGATYQQDDRVTELSKMSDGEFMSEMRQLSRSG